MALNYDFDMLSMSEKAETGDASAPLSARPDPVALFREPATVAALERAPQAVQEYLRASHFGINCYHSGAPAGRYPEVDEGARITVIEALTENIRRFDLPRADDSQPDPLAFHLPSFFAAVAEAEPISVVPVTATTLPMPASETDDSPPPTLILAEPVPDSATDSLMADIVAVCDGPGASMATDSPAVEPDEDTAAEAATTMVSPEAAGEDMAITAPLADAEVPVPPTSRRFRLPVLPRWLTAGAAVAVLGVAVGSALI